MSILESTTSTFVNNDKRLRRTFSPVILFHDHQFINTGSGDLQHVHISCGNDPAYLEEHKKRIHTMLQANGRYWLDIITWSRDHVSLDHSSPVPSLISSPSPPHYLLPKPIHYPSPKEEDESDKKVTTVTNTNKRRRGNLPKAVTAILRDWLSKHKKHPYPTEEEKAALAAETNLNLNQISNWFINARRRILQSMLEQEQEEENKNKKNELDIIMPYHNNLGKNRDSSEFCFCFVLK
ncbi:uncharacterized protein BX663DRAFT_518105 [Cokeromyces recurvatus]|uniref:uncharacterized protein n=1 Tax=Cokeromyces recurvatus TaxID=90255 RepID=UPI0022203FD9|nr:uncharacterized protein BX663DRAFT_518105 [Cokeromyces recurvatus]KAI7900275.1 hypothetical protein BX663DRAFT_518105 [Cokeromyces recurvatus]